MKKTIGFVGLGIMGRPMAKNLIKNGYGLIIYDIIEQSMIEVEAMGAKRATSPKEVAEQVETIITMLPNSPHVKQAILGENGIVEGAKSGLLIIDMSSIAPLVSKEVYEIVKQSGIRMIDAPVSGGEPKAIDGTLSIMAGGTQEDFDECFDLLKCMGQNVVRVGDIGSGNTAKLVNQVIVALNIAAVSEAFVLGQKAGVDPEILYNAIKGGLAGSTVLNAKIPKIIAGDFKPGFKIDLHIKDLANVLETSRQIGVPMPLTSFVMEIMQSLKVDGKGSDDHSGIIQFYEKLAKIEVRKESENK